MATLKEFRDERIKKLNTLRERGYDPYPALAGRTSEARDIVEQFEHKEGSTQTVFGRIKSIRKFGKIAFIVIRDMSGTLQLFLQS